MKNVELAKVLAVCIAHIDSKFKQLSESLQDLEHQVAPVVLETTEPEKFSLPDGIIFESHLDDALVGIARKITSTKQAISEDLEILHGELATSKTYLAELIEQVETELGRSIEQAGSLYSGVDHVHEYLAESDFEEFRSTLTEDLNRTAEQSSVVAEETSSKILSILEELSSMESHSKDELKRINETFKSLQDIDESLQHKFVETTQSLNELKESSETAQDAIRDDLTNSLCEAIDQSNTALKTLRGEFQAGLGKIQSALMAHQHPELAARDHDHPELASVDDLKNAEFQIQSLLANDINVRSALESLAAELNKKVDTLDVWHKSELPALTNELAARVSAQIVMPKDGKSAKEWDFKFHPSIPGIFMYKREDWKDYKRVNLIRNVPKANEGGGNLIMGGGGGDGSRLTVTRSGNAIEGNVSEIDFRGNVDVTKTGDGAIRVTVLGGSGGVNTDIVAGDNINVDNGDPIFPVVSVGVKLTSAGNTIAYKLVTTDATGKVIHADTSNLTHVNRVLGMAKNSAISGDLVTISNSGIVTNAGWNFTPNQLLYLGINGDITPNPSTGLFSNCVGYAVEPTKISINIGRSIVRG